MVLTLMGICCRLDLAGVTSYVRVLGLRPEAYHRFLHLFHSKGLDLNKLTACWVKLCLTLFKPVCTGSGQLRPGDPFPSVRTLSKDLKINPNTAHKIVAHLVSEGLLETRPGIGTVVAALPDSSQKERTQLLGQEIEQLVVEAKRLGIELAEMLSSISAHWQSLSGGDSARAHKPAAKPEDGGSKQS
jgi:GntR family transcriptional regulator